MRGHRCKRWGDRKEHCVFNTASWHNQDQLDEGDSWDDWTDYKPRTTTLPAWTFLGAAVYKSLLDSYGPKPLPALDPGYVPQSARLFNAAVGLAEIGVVQQLQQQNRTRGGTLVYRSPESVYNRGPGWKSPAQGLPGKSYKQYWEYGETFAVVIGTAAAIAVGGMIGGGPKGKPQGKFGRSPMGTPGVGYSFNMAQNPAYAFMYGNNALRSVTTSVYSQLVGGYVPNGMEVVKERSEAPETLGPTGYPLAPYGSGGK